MSFVTSAARSGRAANVLYGKKSILFARYGTSHKALLLRFALLPMISPRLMSSTLIKLLPQLQKLNPTIMVGGDLREALARSVVQIGFLGLCAAATAILSAAGDASTIMAEST